MTALTEGKDAIGSMGSSFLGVALVMSYPD